MLSDRHYLLRARLRRVIGANIVYTQTATVQQYTSDNTDNKTKVVVYGYESSLTDLIARADSYGVDVNNLPFVLYSPGLHNDLAQFIGWSDLSLNDLSRKPTKEFEQYVRQWIKSPTEKIDVWEVSVSVDEEVQIG